MKIAIITGQWNGGGAESVARDLFTYLNKEGHECFFLYARGEAPRSDKIIKCGKKFEHYFHALIARLFDANGRGSHNATLELVEYLKRINPDVINIHNIVGYSYNLKILFDYLKSVSAKVVWTLHDCWTFTGHCISIDEKNCLKWKQGCGNCPAKRNYPKSVFFDCSRRNFQYKKELFESLNNLVLITPSKWLKTVAMETFHKRCRIEVINNGIDLSVFKPTINNRIREKHGILANKKVILCVANIWTQSKGLEYILRLSEKLDKDRYQFVIIGKLGGGDYEVSSEIIHVKRTSDRDELAEWYAAADVFINPSLADNYPTVNMEALACGTPVVTFNTGGSWESVGEEFGSLAKDKTVESLKVALEECIGKGIKSADCIQQAEKFCRNKRYAEYEKLFDELVRK